MDVSPTSVISRGSAGLGVSGGGLRHQEIDHEPPSPRSGGVPLASVQEAGNAEAGPSMDRGRRQSTGPSPPHSPSSAPTTPYNLTHPPTYIHTHHPRRGSMTPLGLNVISPITPFPLLPNTSSSPVRSIGFSPRSTPQDIPPPVNARRGSAASSSSTLTQSRPLGMSPSNGGLPSGFNRERRRSSLTPAGPTLAPPSPSRAHASGRMGRPTSSDGMAVKPPMLPRTRTAEHIRPHTPLGSSPLSGTSAASDAAYARRGSLPQLNYGGWTGPAQRTHWNPVLPPQRSSVGEDKEETPVLGAIPVGEGFKFGATPFESPAEASLRAASRRASASHLAKAREDMDVFEQAEVEEAERQRKAFIAATFGADGKRARERLSLGGVHMAPGLSHHSSSSSNLRRQSLMIWERLNTAQAASRMSGEGSEVSLQSAPPVALSHAQLPFGDDDSVAARRGSLPIAIPNLIRSPSSFSREGDTFDKPPKIVAPGDSTDEEEEPDEEEQVAEEDDLRESDPAKTHKLQRPMPPLLPLSDPGPRLLNSTLALHRANHLLTSRNLQAEPLPHPLPPSLHPPAPVEVSEFDLDFIISGSRAQLGGDKRNRNAPVDVSNPADSFPIPQTPTLKLGPGGEDEDSFAKFVGKFDDEYGDRRGEWSFRALPRPGSPSLDPTTPSDIFSPSSIRAEWISIGAGGYEITDTNHVRSAQTGSEWCVNKSGSREYQLHEVQRGHEHGIEAPEQPDGLIKPTIIASGAGYIITSKAAHREAGGIKLAQDSENTWLPPKKDRMGSSATAMLAPKLRVSISDSLNSDRTARLGSTDSNATARPAPNLSTSAPMSGMPKMSKKPRQFSKGEDDRGRNSSSESSKGRPPRARSGERHSEDDKSKKGLGGVFKKGFMSSLKPSNLVAAAEEKRAQKEERAREKGQSHSWSPSQSHRSNFVQPSNQNFTRSNPGSYKSGLPDRTSSSTAAPGSVHTTPRSYAEERPAPPPPLMPLTEDKRTSTPHHSPRLLPVQDEDSGLQEGKAWSPVPEEAVAMVVPIESDDLTSPMERPRSIGDHRQALLVWWVPFNSESAEERDKMSASGSYGESKPPSIDSVSAASHHSHHSHHSQSSLPKLQRLLRRRTSKDKESLKQRDGSGSMQSKEDKLSYLLHPLPFRSFRVVARVVDVDDLRSEPDFPGAAGEPSFGDWQQSMLPSSVARAASSSSSNPSPIRLVPSLPGTDEVETASSSTAPTSTILAGRTFPTVIAVCHSRSQGVEFVLEGLDRLGFCVGESAWGPTGYEEWRGSGLSNKGRELLDLLWAGCTGVMGLTGV